MASEPYWAAAPSRSTSACRMAIEGMTEMSGPCEPSAMPLPSQVMTAARVAALAVDQDQRVVRGEVAQVSGPDDGRGVAPRTSSRLNGWAEKIGPATTSSPLPTKSRGEMPHWRVV